MFWFWKKNKLQKELDEAKERIQVLESKVEVASMTMHNLQILHSKKLLKNPLIVKTVQSHLKT